MLKFNSMKWSHILSYGANNEIYFDTPLTQLVGKNGHGKSSIAVILEEVLYNKNSKGIKKADLLNRYTDKKSYSIELSFNKDNDEYYIYTTRSSTQSVKLLKNGEDISEHTATATYKLIEKIVGYDHKTFTQIVYQSSPFSLEFLTATDSNRKKFLVELLNLNIYTDIAERIKIDIKDLGKDVELLNSKISSIDTWLSRINKDDLIYLERVEVPEPASTEAAEIGMINEKLSNIEKTNKQIAQNNQYRAILGSMDIKLVPAPTKDILQLKVQQSRLLDEINNYKKVISSNGRISSTCPSCGQTIDTSHKKLLVFEAEQCIADLKTKLEIINAEIADEEKVIMAYNAANENNQTFEKYSRLLDNSLSKELLDKDALEARLKELQTIVNNRTIAISNANKHNKLVDEHNSKAKVLSEQMTTMLKDRDPLIKELELLNTRASALQILNKTFSPSGFIAYKIESLVKDLEDITNKYLTEMSDGRFQLSFRISASDKLDVVIIDNGQDIDINALSNGELARVNVSTLIAIRTLMQSLSNTQCNLLILDETIESLDLEGKEKLIEVLLSEKHLNTILVSHGFTHPLLSKLEIVKENNISRIEA